MQIYEIIDIKSRNIPFKVVIINNSSINISNAALF